LGLFSHENHNKSGLVATQPKIVGNFRTENFKKAIVNGAQK